MSDIDREAIVRTIEEAREAILELTGSLTPAQLGRETPCEGWSVKDLLAHMVASEASLVASSRRALAGDPARPAGHNVDRSNADQVESRRTTPLAELEREMRRNRHATLALLAGLTDAQLEMPLEGPGGVMRNVAWRLQRIGEHEREHLGHLRAALK